MGKTMGFKNQLSGRDVIWKWWKSSDLCKKDMRSPGIVWHLQEDALFWTMYGWTERKSMYLVARNLESIDRYRDRSVDSCKSVGCLLGCLIRKMLLQHIMLQHPDPWPGGWPGRSMTPKWFVWHDKLGKPPKNRPQKGFQPPFRRLKQFCLVEV